MKRTQLTAAFVKSVREPGMYQGGGGLMLVVRSTGSRQWVQRLTIHGKRRSDDGDAAGAGLAHGRDARSARPGDGSATMVSSASGTVRAREGHAANGVRHARRFPVVQNTSRCAKAIEREHALGAPSRTRLRRRDACGFRSSFRDWTFRTDAHAARRDGGGSGPFCSKQGGGRLCAQRSVREAARPHKGLGALSEVLTSVPRVRGSTRPRISFVAVGRFALRTAPAVRRRRERSLRRPVRLAGWPRSGSPVYRTTRWDR